MATKGQPLILERGTAVVTRDGKKLGKVDETRPAYFKVDAPHAHDYWLDLACVERASASEVVLGFEAKDLDRYRKSEPAMAGAVPATSLQQSFLPGATPEDANVHYDPALGPEPRADRPQ